MAEKIVEITVRHISSLPDNVKRDVIQEASKIGSNFSNYARISYAEASPKRIVKVEPIMGNPLEEFI